MTHLKLRKIYPCLFAIIIDSMGFGLVYPLISDLFYSSNYQIVSPDTPDKIRHFYLSIVFLLYPLWMFFGVSFLGDLSDYWGRKKILQLSMIGLTLGYLLMGLGIVFSNLGFLMLGRSLTGISAGSEAISQAVVVDLSFLEDKNINMSKVSFTVCLGLIIGPLIGGIFSDAKITTFFNLSTPFFIAAFLSIVAFFCIYWGFSETLNSQKRKLEIRRTFQVYVEVIRHKKVRYLYLIGLSFQVGFGIYYQTMSIFLKQKIGYTNSGVGFFYVVLGTGFSIGLLVLTRLIRRKKTIVASIAAILIALMGIGQFISTWLTHSLSLIIVAFFIAVFNSTAYNELIVTFSNEVEADKQGWVMGIFSSTLATGFVLVAFTTNLLNIISLQVLLILGSVISLLSALGMKWLYRKSLL